MYTERSRTTEEWKAVLVLKVSQVSVVMINTPAESSPTHGGAPRGSSGAFVERVHGASECQHTINNADASELKFSFHLKYTQTMSLRHWFLHVIEKTLNVLLFWDNLCIRKLQTHS